MKYVQHINGEQAGVIAAVSSFLSACVAGAACIGPLLGIALGVGGLGWMSQLTYLSIPASVISVSLLVAALYLFTHRKSSCANRRAHQLKRFVLGGCAFMVIAINVFEYVIIPSLG